MNQTPAALCLPPQSSSAAYASSGDCGLCQAGRLGERELGVVDALLAEVLHVLLLPHVAFLHFVVLRTARTGREKNQIGSSNIQTGL